MMLNPGSTRPSPGGDEVVLTGRCEVPLRRAVVPYRDPEEAAFPGGRLRDLGLGLVLDDAQPSRMRVLDLGSGEVRHAGLGGPLVLLGWVFSRLHRELEGLVEQGTPPELLARRTRPLALRILLETGFGPVTRALHLRMGFQDLCQDLDLHEGAAIRLSTPDAGPLRCHLDYEGSTLVVRTGRSQPVKELEEALAEAFPTRRILRVLQGEGRLTGEYQVDLPMSRSLSELRQEIRGLRRGFLHLLARFEPRRFQALKEAAQAFGERDSLAVLEGVPFPSPLRSGEWLGTPADLPGAGAVH
jgi:hypothetical protein